MGFVLFKKGLAVGIIFFLVISSVPYSILSNEISTGTFDGNILYVGGSGPGNYSIIQNAINDASDGDTIFVFDDIKIEDTSGCDCELGCELEIELIPDRYRIAMIITNVGDSDCTNVKWSITLDGGIILLGRVTTGIIFCIPPGENVTVYSNLIFGFGRTVITISVDPDGGPPMTAEQEAYIILFFIII